MRFRIHRQWEDGKVEALARSREFGWMEYRELQLIAPYLAETTAAAGVTLITEGQPNRHFFLLISGVLEATKDGGHKRFLRAGESFGATPLSTSESATETIRAVTAARLLVAAGDQNQSQSHPIGRRADGQPARAASMTMVPNLA
jgi:signal-transduction protein with cAMP-binding, CBS, and nucleotidyltransferase domain